MMELHCRKESVLSEEEKHVFRYDLQTRRLSADIWTLFQEWIQLSDSRVGFFFLKVYENERLIGLGMFIELNAFTPRASFAAASKKNALLKAAVSTMDLLGKKCLYVCVQNLITVNNGRPFFFREDRNEERVMNALLSHLKSDNKPDMITLVDTADQCRYYNTEGYRSFPCPSGAYFDVRKYSRTSEYLNTHKSLKKNLSRKKGRIRVKVFSGPLPEKDMDQIKKCLSCSTKNSRALIPAQEFFDQYIFTTSIFTSSRYIHIVVRVDGHITGFHTFQVCGDVMGGVVGGFNREHLKNSFVYERIMVASLDYAIRNNIERVHFALVDNLTKLRLVNAFEPCRLFFYSRSPLQRFLFQQTYKHSDLFNLYLMEQQGLLKYHKQHQGENGISCGY